MRNIISNFRPTLWSVTLAIALFFLAGAGAISSWAAETPEEAIAAGLSPMPEGWESGVYNGGHYYKWPTLEQHPEVFILCILVTISSQIYIAITVLSERAAYLRDHPIQKPNYSSREKSAIKNQSAGCLISLTALILSALLDNGFLPLVSVPALLYVGVNIIHNRVSAVGWQGENRGIYAIDTGVIIIIVAIIILWRSLKSILST